MSSDMQRIKTPNLSGRPLFGQIIQTSHGMWISWKVTCMDLPSAKAIIPAV